MFQINDILFHTKLQEEIKLIGVEYDPNTRKMTYLTERENEEIIESDFYSLIDVRYI